MVSATRIHWPGIIYMIQAPRDTSKHVTEITCGYIYVKVNFMATVADDYETFWWNIPVIDAQNDLR